MARRDLVSEQPHPSLDPYAAGASGNRRCHTGGRVGLVDSARELELELIQSHMAQKPVLRGEVGCACVAREVSVEMENQSARSG